MYTLRYYKENGWYDMVFVSFSQRQQLLTSYLFPWKMKPFQYWGLFLQTAPSGLGDKFLAIIISATMITSVSIHLNLTLLFIDINLHFWIWTSLFHCTNTACMTNYAYHHQTAPDVSRKLTASSVPERAEQSDQDLYCLG